MEQLNPQLLDEMLEVLQDHGVTEFSCPSFHVRLGVVVTASTELDPEIAHAIQRRNAIANAPKGNYSHPSLWHGGRPPEFPGTAKPTSPFKEE